MGISSLKSYSTPIPGHKAPKGITMNFPVSKKLGEGKSIANKYDIIVFTNTAWEFINQRPRQLVEHLAKYNQILFIEEPYINEKVERENYRIIKLVDNLTVIRPVLKNLDNLREIINSFIKGNVIPVGWFFSASYYPLINQLKFGKIIYDIENEIVSPSETMKKNENMLLKKSDIVITGSKAAFEEKVTAHKNVHWIPSPVDDVFFKRRKRNQAPDCLINPERPIIGYCGVIDNRINFDFLEEAAAKMPFATFVLIGPVLHPGREKLPEQTNISYLNLSKYSAMPSYLKAIDIAMVPFVMDDRSRYVSSSLILKYMAANKPIISTPVYDIVRDYSHCIDIVSTPEEFCISASRKLIPNRAEHEERWICYNKILNRNSWEDAAIKIQKLMKVKKEVAFTAVFSDI